jgi:phage terminase large subunit
MIEEMDISEIELAARFAADGLAAGCPADQIENFLQAGIVLQPRQLVASAAARACDAPDGPMAVGYGGARAGGKSYWLIAQMGVDDCQRVPGLKCLLLRKVGKSNVENFQDFRQRVFTNLKHEYAAHRGVLKFTNGSQIRTGHFQNEKDIDAYLGLEYDVIGVEEATTLTWRKYQDISTCCRSSKPNFRPRMYSTTNPGGVGHKWYKTKFIVPAQRGCETETRFIPAKAADNLFINPEYQAMLRGMTGWQKRAWCDGDWDIAAGQFFPNFRRDVHVRSDIDPGLAREWRAALDYGFTHYTVAQLGFEDGDGNFHVVDEHAERQWLPQRHAEAIGRMLRRHGLGFHNLKRFVAGADVFSRQSDGRTIAQEYSKHGIRLTPANTDRVNGWAEILRRLGDVSAGIRPKLFIHERCGRLIETLPSLQHDPNRPEDVLKVDCDEDGNGGDDAADCMRYLVCTKPAQVYLRKLTGW